MLLSSSARVGASSGALLYDYEYELESTRGRKRVLNTVAIASAKLYILNGQVRGTCIRACTCSGKPAAVQRACQMACGSGESHAHPLAVRAVRV